MHGAGDLDGAVTLAVQGVEIAARTIRPQLPGAMTAVAELRSQRGERDEARHVTHEALRLAETQGFQVGQLAAELTLARVEVGAAEPEGAAAWLDRAQRSLETTGSHGRMPELLEVRGEIAHQRGDVSGRDQALAEALRLYREMGAAGHAERLERELAS
jgi:gamma-glutamyltranspeptidase